MEEKIGSDYSTDQAGDRERNHHAAGKIEMLPVSAGARRNSDPQRNGICGVSRNRRHSREHQRRKSNKTAAARNGIQRAAQHSGDE
jgi:hypothetical protein